MAQAERSVSVVLKADVRDYTSGLDKATKATKDFATQTGKVSGSASTATKNLGTSAKAASSDLDGATKSTKGFGDAAGKASDDATKASKSTKNVGDSAKSVGIGMAAAGAAIAVGIGAAVKAFADFDQEMSNVRAVSGATAGEMLQLKDAALEAGAATSFSASQAAEAQAELVKAGISVQDVLGGALSGTLDLAAAGSLGLAQAAEVAANAMNIFSLNGKDVGHIADVLAAGANKSATDVGELGQALQQSGLVAAQMGLSLEETTGLLAAFADNGLKGSDAGTSLKTMLQRLVPASAAASTAMKQIGFSAFDAQGKMKSIDTVAGDLRKGLSTLTQEQQASTLATIFGSDAVRGANIAFKLGAEGVREYTTAVDDTGAATDVAKEKLNNLSGDIEGLRGSIETALIKGGSGANDALRGLAQGATSVVNAFSALPEGVQAGAVKVAALTSGVLLLGGGLITVIPKIIATKEAIEALAAASPKAAAAMGALGKAGLVVGIAAAGEELKNLAAAATVAEVPVERLAKGLDELASGAEQSADFASIFNRGWGPFAKNFDNASEALEDFGANARIALDSSVLESLFGGAGQASEVFEKRIGQIDKALASMVQSGNGKRAAESVEQLERAAQSAGLKAGVITAQLGEYKTAVEGAAVAGGKYVDSTKAFGSGVQGAVGPAKLLGDELKEQEESAKAAEKAYKNLTDAVKDYGSELAGSLSAASKYEASIDSAAERVQKRAEIQAQIAKLQKADAKGNAEEIARLQDQLKGYAATLDLSSEAGRTNTASLLAIADAAKESAVANLENGVSFGELKGQMDNARATFINQALAFGATKDQARSMADQLGLTQQNLQTLATAADVKKTVTADTTQADKNLLSVTRQLAVIDATVATATVQIQYERVGPSAEAVAGLASGAIAFKGFAAGGYTGPGLKYEPAGVVHRGEYVFTKEETAKAGVANLAELSKKLRGYATGGPVQPRFASQSFSSATTNQMGGNVTNDRRIHIDNVNAADFASFEREAYRRDRLHALGRRGTR